MTLRLRPVVFADACRFVAEHHRHHRPPQGHKFSIAVHEDGRLCGVIMVGRPVARMLDDGETLEVTRSATDGTRHVNSMLYAAAWRATKALGYTRLITYTLEAESGASLRGAGFRLFDDGRKETWAGGWSRGGRPRGMHGTEGAQRLRWMAS
jgi:hypothetical protein